MTAAEWERSPAGRPPVPRPAVPPADGEPGQRPPVPGLVWLLFLLQLAGLALLAALLVVQNGNRQLLEQALARREAPEEARPGGDGPDRSKPPPDAKPADRGKAAAKVPVPDPGPSRPLPALPAGAGAEQVALLKSLEERFADIQGKLLLLVPKQGDPDLKKLDGDVLEAMKLLKAVDQSLKTGVGANSKQLTELAARLEKLEGTSRQYHQRTALPADVVVLALTSSSLDMNKYAEVFLDLFKKESFAQNFKNYRLGFSLGRGDGIDTIVGLADKSPIVEEKKFSDFGPPGQSTELLPDLAAKVREQFPNSKLLDRRCIVVASTNCPVPEKAKEAPWQDLAVDAILLRTDPKETPDLRKWLDFCSRHRGCLAVLPAPVGDQGEQKLMDELKYQLARLAHPQLVKPVKDKE